ncbi:MAG: hypothetical protein IJU91_01530 [Selenomonadaceae bacterium]|nr:hypothetical protein [Selenomonadaceae bacterium]
MRLLKILPMLKILPIIFLLLIIPAKSFAEMPEITAGQTYFDVFKGHYVLKDNVKVVMNNHGWKATVTATEARVNVVTQKCWALGKVNFQHEDYNLKCENAYLQWQTKTADLTGGIDFDSKKIIKVKSETATFNWEDKIADFYGKVQVKIEKGAMPKDAKNKNSKSDKDSKSDKNSKSDKADEKAVADAMTLADGVTFAEGVEFDENAVYAHVRYNVTENKILQLDKTFDIPQIEIPDPDK